MLAPVIDHLWQSTLIVIGACAATLLLRGHAARWRYWLWFAASMKFLVPFALLAALGAQFAWRTTPVEPVQGEWREIARQVFEPSAAFVDEASPTPAETVPASAESLAPTPPEAGTALADALVADLRASESNAAVPAPADSAAPQAAAETSRWETRLLLAALAVWMLGTLAILSRWAWRWLGLRAMTKQAKPLTVVRIGNDSLEVRSCPSIMEPGVFGILRPVLLIPEGIVHRLTPHQLDAIVAHERVHIERRDNLTASLHMLVEALFWFHPFVWWIGARLVHERERACDEAVLAAGVDPKHYASGLVEVCGFYVDSPLICAAGVGGGSLEDRVQRITENPPPRPLGRVARAAIVAVPVAVFTVPVAIGLLSAPVIRAQVAGGQGSNPLQCVDSHVLNSLMFRGASTMTYSDAMPDELADVPTPPEFEWIGSARRDGQVGARQVTAAYRTSLSPADARTAALRALESDDWELQVRPQRPGMRGVFLGARPPQADTVCLGDKTLNLLASAIDDTTYVTFGIPLDRFASSCARPADERFVSRGMYDDFMPRLEFPPDPETGAPTRVNGGGMSSGGAGQQNTTEITHRAPLADIADYLARQLTDQGWKLDANWIGTTTVGSSWTKEFDSGERVHGTLEITRTRDTRHTVAFRVAALQ